MRRRAPRMRMMEPKLRMGPVIRGQRMLWEGRRCSYWLWPCCWRFVRGEATSSCDVSYLREEIIFTDDATTFNQRDNY